MKKWILALIVASLATSWVFAGDILKIRDDAPNTYVVQKGDTLWSISGIFLEDPWLWPELWHFNPQLDNPHLIYPGDLLKLIWVDGKPRLIFARDEVGGKRGDIKLTPQMRISDLGNAIPPIPLDAIQAFLGNGRVVGKDELEMAPHVLAGREGRIIAGAGDQIYGRGEFPEDNDYGIYRRGQTFVDPQTGEFLGVQALDIGSARKLYVDDDVATLELNRSAAEVRRADRFLPLEELEFDSNFQPRAPEQEVVGEIIAVERGINQVGNLSVVILNRGSREGLAPGHVLAIYKRGETVRDPVKRDLVKVPDYRGGLAMVFRSFDKVSYALVLRAQVPMSVGDAVRNP